MENGQLFADIDGEPVDEEQNLFFCQILLFYPNLKNPDVCAIFLFIAKAKTIFARLSIIINIAFIEKLFEKKHKLFCWLKSFSRSVF